MEILFYDIYYDIPLRGIVLLAGHRLPFLAEIDQDADDQSWEKGIPARVRLFRVIPGIEAEFEFIKREFEKWKAEGALSSHPLVDNVEYQQAGKRIDDTFSKLSDSIAMLNGLFSNDGVRWRFKSDSDEGIDVLNASNVRQS